MCLTCGCNAAHKAMGHNLTCEEVREVATANGKTVDETLRTMIETAASNRARHVQEYERPPDAGRQ